MTSPAPSPAPTRDGAVLALLGRLEDDPKLAGKGLGSAFAASFPDLPAEASSLAATEAARVAVILGVPGIAVNTAIRPVEQPNLNIKVVDPLLAIQPKETKSYHLVTT